jgi:hypothetical protein
VIICSNAETERGIDEFVLNAQEEVPTYLLFLRTTKSDLLSPENVTFYVSRMSKKTNKIELGCHILPSSKFGLRKEELLRTNIRFLKFLDEYVRPNFGILLLFHIIFFFLLDSGYHLLEG